MRLLHTSDWHLGRSFHREDLLGAQAAFADHLVETVQAEGVDAVLVSGDVYDRALPSVDAVRLYGETLTRLAGLTRVVLISGNHDSALRLGVGADLMDAAGVHVRTDPAKVGEPVVIGDVAIYAIPYLEPELLRQPWDLAERSHTAVLTEAMDRIRTDAAGRTGSKVVLAHAFVTGGEPSDSERDISVGGAANVAAGLFAGADYVALGHLHGRQRVSETVRYSGSPLAYSFSEEHHRKGSWLVDLTGGGIRSEFVEAPVPRRLARLRGRLEELLTSDAHERFEDHWLQITLTDTNRPEAAMARLRRRFPHVLVLGFEPEGVVPTAARGWSERIAQRSGPDLAADFLTEVTGEPAGRDACALLQEAFEACRQREAVK
jgi:exonuclease SbcD